MAPAPLTPHIENVEEFLSHCHRRRYPAKSTIIYAGDQGDTLYYIIKGSVTVMIEDDSDGKEIILAYLNPGDFFGEMGLFDNMDSRSAWVKAKSECEVAEISYTKFREISSQDSKILYFTDKVLLLPARKAVQSSPTRQNLCSKSVPSKQIVF